MKVDESLYYLDSFALPKITTKTMAYDEKQAVTSSFSSSFLVSSLDFVSSFLSVAVSFSFFCSATGAMLESIRSRLAQTPGISYPVLSSFRLTLGLMPLRGHKFLSAVSGKGESLKRHQITG